VGGADGDEVWVVVQALNEYEAQDDAGRESRIAALLGLDDHQGVPAVCKIIGYDRSIVVAKLAAREGIRFEGAAFEIEKHMQESPRRISRFTGFITLPPGLDAKQRAKLEACVSACPVSRSLHPEVKLDFKFR